MLEERASHESQALPGRALFEVYSNYEELQTHITV